MFKKIELKDLNLNVFEAFDKQWALLSAGNINHANTMTIAWGTLGYLWKKNIGVIFVRPQRYTNQFIKNNDYFTLSFFDEQYKDSLRICGTKSGENCNKIKEAHLTLVPFNESVSFLQAKLVFVFKKIYTDKIKPENFLDDSIQKSYPIQDYHDVYIGEIISCYIQE